MAIFSAADIQCLHYNPVNKGSKKELRLKQVEIQGNVRKIKNVSWGK